jgi:hypothetical protein
MNPRIPLHASSFRIFRGYKKADLAENTFLKNLGETFMPGTPLMLRDLGLAAYLLSVLPVTAAAADVPDEVAIIAYPSQEGYAWARNNTNRRPHVHEHASGRVRHDQEPFGLPGSHRDHG